MIDDFTVDYEKFISGINEILIKKNNSDFDTLHYIEELVENTFHLRGSEIEHYVSIFNIMESLGCDLREIYCNKEYVKKLNKLSHDNKNLCYV